jgi:hypothetical protein
MSSQEAVHVSLSKVTPRSGKETLGTWWFHVQRGGRTQSRPKPTHEMELSCEQTIRNRGVCEPALEPRGEWEGSRTRRHTRRVGALSQRLTRIGHEPPSLSVVQPALTPSGCMYTLIVPLEPNRVPERAHSQFQETCYGEPHHRYHHARSGIPP